jgi:hypothetical protein
MRLQLEGNDRALLEDPLGLRVGASDADIAAAVTARLMGSATSAGRARLGEPAPSTAPARPAASTDPDCEATIAAAVRDGKFSAERAQHYRDLWARNPQATRRSIARLHPGVVRPTVASTGDDAYPAEWLRLPANRVTHAD